MTTSAIQALAMGLPCITTDHSGFREQIIDGKNGFIVPEGDWQALGEKILYYMEHDELWASFGRFGREYMLKNYDNNALIGRQIDIYQSLLK
jgi:colanic acid/amylovoran biosynthesis glycosyltransferase